MDSRTFDIEAVAQEVLLVEPLLEVDTLTPENRLPDAGEVTVVVKGDVMPGAVVRGARSLVVEGAVLGSFNLTPQVDVGEDVVVLGYVRQAAICARRIRIGKDASRCRLKAGTDIEVGGDLVDVQIVSGESGNPRGGVEELEQRVVQCQQEREATLQQLRVEQKRLDKLLKATRIAFEVNIGQIVRRHRDRLEINLRPFYEVVGEKSEEEIDRALNEFFAKAVMGLLTRINRTYITGSPTQRQAFMTVVRRLHDLLFLTRNIDKQAIKIGQNEERLKRMGDRPEAPISTVYVRGAVLPGLDLQFVLPEADSEAGERFSGRSKTATLTLRPGADVSQREIVRVDTGGEDEILIVSPEELQDVVFQVHSGQVTWDRVRL